MELGDIIVVMVATSSVIFMLAGFLVAEVDERKLIAKTLWVITLVSLFCLIVGVVGLTAMGIGLI